MELKRCIDSATVTANYPEVLGIFPRLDDDDPAPYAVALESDDVLISALRFPRGLGNLSEMWNQCQAQAAAHCTIFMHCADDLIFRTQGWDDAVRAAFDAVPDRIAFVHGDDGHWGGTLGTHGFLHHRWVEAVGYFLPPYFSCDYNDTWLTEVADAIGRHVYLPDVLVEHMHPAFSKGPWDQTHEERAARGLRDDVAGLYARLAPERARDAEKLRAAMGMT